jgi:anti-sigma-K factor RskA
MKLTAHPELLELLAASHALGTLRGGARRRFETLAREQAPVRAAALVWQSRLASMTELQSPVVPDAAVWTRIRNIIDAEKAQHAIERQRDAPMPATPPSPSHKAVGSAASRSGAAPRPPARSPPCWPWWSA